MQFDTRLAKARVLAQGMVALAMFFAVNAADAGTRVAYGVGGIVQPTVGGANFFERGPIPVTTSLTVDGTGTGTSVGKGFTLPANVMVISGGQQRDFSSFGFLAQTSFTFMTTQASAERFAAGLGAAATGAINFCPPIADPNPLNGNLNCQDYANPGLGNYSVRIGIDQRRSSPMTGTGVPIGNAFGGTLRIGRNVANAAYWFNKPPFCSYYARGPGGCVQIVSRAPRTNTGLPWTPGATNFNLFSRSNPKGPLYNAWLTKWSGQISTLLDCSSGTCEPGEGFPTQMVQTGALWPDDFAWGFRMTTGVVSGSDSYPPVGPDTSYFSFITSGTDKITPGGNRNIVLIGGSIVRSGASGQLFNRLNILELTLAVPEPALTTALAAGMLGLIAFARVRRSSS